VSVDGTPTDWRTLDRFVGEATKRGFDLLPVVLRTPEWARRHKKVLASTPTAAGRKAYANFMAALVNRYGHDGTFWADHPYVLKRPIERWQVWNEPNGPVFWAEQPGLPDYVKLLKEAAPAIREADPEAQIVLAGLFGKAWKPLRRLYIYGARDYFDYAAVNPFSFKVSNVMYIIERARDIMHLRGADDTPLLVTELSWPSAKGKTKNPYGFEVTERGQAQRIRESFAAIAAERRKLNIDGLFWSTWVSYDRRKDQSFDYAGLRRIKGKKVVNKPAYHAFKSVVGNLTGSAR
jgi:polysaccharide biosynthesis protein PslG